MDTPSRQYQLAFPETSLPSPPLVLLGEWELLTDDVFSFGSARAGPAHARPNGIPTAGLKGSSPIPSSMTGM